MTNEDGYPGFYAEISTPEYIKLSYAPEGRCLGCDAKLSKYRKMEAGSWEQWCSLCTRKGIFPLQCDSCWETFPSYGTRIICSKCLVPAQRTKRRELAEEKAAYALDLLARYGWSEERVTKKLEYSSVLELRRVMVRLSVLVQESDDY